MKVGVALFHNISFFFKTVEGILMKLHRKQALMALYQFCTFGPDGHRGGSRAGQIMSK